MFKSLLRTIPSISGNFTLACRLNNIIKKSDKEYHTYINSAILLPLDNNIKLFKDINVNLTNAKYEYDVQRYWKLISDKFYGDTYSMNESIFDEYDLNTINLKDNRDKNFEYGCSRLPINYTGYQFRFYAPIYINNIDDLPDSFNILIKNQNNQILKKIVVDIGSKVNVNKLRIYLTKFLNKLHNNTPVYWNFKDNKIIYKNAIDCKNGGLINFTSYNVIKNNTPQVVINDFDNSISYGYASNNIIMGEVIPLSFMFNLEDIIDPHDLYYYHFNNFIISGSYVKDGIQQSFYDFDINYHYKDIKFKDIDVNYGSYNINTYNLFNNSVHNAYQEGTEIRLYYENTLTHNYFRWKKFESDDYIINANAAYTSEYGRYGQFPILKNSINVIPNTYITNDENSYMYNNLVIPIKEFQKYFSEEQINLYEYICNNYYSDWFNIYDENKLFDSEWSKVMNHYTYHNGIYYKIDEDIDYFNVFVKPIYQEYNKNTEYANWCFEYKNRDNNEIISINDAVANMHYVSSNKYLKIVDDIDSINTDDKLYIKCSYNTEYIKYSDIADLIADCNNEDILSLFNRIIGYEKLSKISNANSVQDSSVLLYSMLYNNTQLYNNLYYSEPNSKIKTQLKVFLEKNNYDAKLFQENTFTFFIKNLYVYLYTTPEIESKINDVIYSTSSSSLDSKYASIYPTLINKIKRITSTALSNVKANLSIGNTIFDGIYDGVDNLTFNDKSDIEYNVEYILFLLQYKQLLSILIKNNNIQKYHYISYFNNNSTVIDYDYFQAIGTDNISYDYLYVDSYNLINYLSFYGITLPASISSSKTQIFVNINSKELLNAYIDELYNTEVSIERDQYQFINNLYHCIYFINDKLEIESRIIPLIDYLNSFSDFPFTMSNETLLYILQNYVSFNDNYSVIALPVSNGTWTVKCNLYYKKSMYKMNPFFYNQCLSNNIPLYIYKSSNDNIPESIIRNDDALYSKSTRITPFKLAYSLSSSPFYDSNTVFNQQILLNNMHYENGNYVYENPKNSFKEVTLNEYLTQYRNTHDLYIDTHINEITVNDNLIIVNHDNKKYGYLLINYNFDLSSNSFNVYSADDNDNIEIKYINNRQITNDYINAIFKSIYPYMKSDILISNYSELKKYIILPENVTLIIDKQVIYYPTYTQLDKSEKNTKIYINRYFGNIDPMFVKIDNVINHQYSKLFKSTQDKNLENELPNYNNLIEESINIYHYNPVTYIASKTKLNYNYEKAYQLEYKHFNDNNLFILPQELTFTHDDIPYVDYDTQRSTLMNEEACFKYFKHYVKSKYYSNLSDNLLLFLFKKYTIQKYEESIVKYNLKINRKYCTITYKLSLN